MKNLNNHNITTLVLLTNSFPYGLGEPFLETEVRYLSMYFKNVIILPRIIDNYCRNVPNNVIVNTGFSDHIHSIERKVKLVFFSLSSGMFWKEYFRKPKIVFSFGAISRLLETCGQAVKLSLELKQFITNEVDVNKTLFYSYWLDGSALGICLLKLKENPKINCVSRVHRFDLYEERQPCYYLPLQKFILNNLDVLIPISDHGRSYLIEKYGLNPDKIVVSRLGVDDPYCITRTSQNGELHIVSCSFLVPIKRVHLIIDAISLFGNGNAGRKIYWSHLGDGLLRQYLERYAKKHLPDNVQYSFQGYLPNKEVIQFYRDNIVDVLINVSESEGIPVSIMEAYSCGIPAIATAVGGTPEIVNEDNGWLLSPNPTAREIAIILDEVCFDKKLLKKKKEIARETWQNLYSAEDNYLAFSNTLCATFCNLPNCCHSGISRNPSS